MFIAVKIKIFLSVPYGVLYGSLIFNKSIKAEGARLSTIFNFFQKIAGTA